MSFQDVHHLEKWKMSGNLVLEEKSRKHQGILGKIAKYQEIVGEILESGTDFVTCTYLIPSPLLFTVQPCQGNLGILELHLVDILIGRDWSLPCVWRPPH